MSLENLPVFRVCKPNKLASFARSIRALENCSFLIRATSMARVGLSYLIAEKREKDDGNVRNQ